MSVLLLESGDRFLLESGDGLLLESGTGVPPVVATGLGGFLLESGDALLLESGDALLLEWSSYLLSSPDISSVTAEVTFGFDPNSSGTIHYVVGPAIGWLDPTPAEVAAGELGGGDTPTFADSEAAPADAGAWSGGSAITGMDPGTEYRVAFVYQYGGDYSNVAVSDPVTASGFQPAWAMNSTLSQGIAGVAHA